MVVMGHGLFCLFPVSRTNRFIDPYWIYFSVQKSYDIDKRACRAYFEENKLRRVGEKT